MNKIWNALFNTLHQSMIILSEWHYCDGSWFCINIGNKWKWLNVSKSWGGWEGRTSWKSWYDKFRYIEFFTFPLASSTEFWICTYYRLKDPGSIPSMQRQFCYVWWDRLSLEIISPHRFATVEKLKLSAFYKLCQKNKDGAV